MGGAPKKKFSVKKGILAGLIGAGIGAAIAFAPATAILAGAATAARFAAPKIARAILPKTIKGAVLSTAAIGALTSSKRLREAVVKAPKTVFTGGQKVGRIIDDPGSAEDVLGLREKKTVGEKVLQGAKVAGVGGALIAGAVGVKKIIDLKKSTPTPQIVAVPTLPGLRDVGIRSPTPTQLSTDPLIRKQPALMGRPGAPVTQQPTKPVTNIIQIQVS